MATGGCAVKLGGWSSGSGAVLKPSDAYGTPASTPSADPDESSAQP
jgi:hypothetical protein